MMVILLLLSATLLYALPINPTEYTLLKKFRETGDLGTALFIMEHYPEAVFINDLRVETAKVYYDRSELEKARHLISITDPEDLSESVRELYGELVKSLGMGSREDYVRFPHMFLKELKGLDLSEEEREKVSRALYSKGMYEEVLSIGTCFYKGLALRRMKDLPRSTEVLKSCEDPRSDIYVLINLLKMDKIEDARSFARKRDRSDLYIRLGRYFLSVGDLKEAKKHFLLASDSYDGLFNAGVVDFIEGRYLLAYERFHEAEKLSKGNLQKAQALYWKHRAALKLGHQDIAHHYLHQSSQLAGFYSAVAKATLKKEIHEEVRMETYGKPMLALRFAKIKELGFVEYMRKEAFKNIDLLTPEDVLRLVDTDPYLAIKVAVKRFGANSDIYRAIAFPTPFRALVKRAKERFGVDPALIYAVMRQESLFDTKAVSTSNAKGLMQLIDSTANWMAERIGLQYEDIFNPEVNITLGTAYLKFLMDYWKGDLTKVIASYNAGQGAVSKWKDYDDDFIFIETIPYEETRKYVKRVLWFYYIYSEKFLEEAF